MAKNENPKKAAPARRRTTVRKQPDANPTPDAAPGNQVPPLDGAPTLDDIARRAYEIYQARGGRDGTDLDDWLQAERELADARRQSTD